jgi:glycosyltransferase involved in cell wall biosynthesis
MYETEEQNGAALETATRNEAVRERIFGTYEKWEAKNRKPLAVVPPLPEINGAGYQQPVLAIFCHEEAGSVVGEFVVRMAQSLADKNLDVHLFAHKGFKTERVTHHVIDDSREEELLDQVQDFARQAGNEFLRLFPVSSIPITLLGCEWSSVPVLTLLQGIRNLNVFWSVHSLERQRSDMTSDLSNSIEEIELAGLRAAKAIIVHDPATVPVCKSLQPECAHRIINDGQVFPVAHFQTDVDPGQIKARYQVGPIDPTILFVGDLSERYGPDLLVKAMPAILKNHPQARLIIVGEGALYWPLRVYTRYLLLEHAVRLVGNVEGQALKELIQAADIIAQPSRSATPWWPILASWAAHRPVVATHETAPNLLKNEHDSVLCYPSENSCVWGIERYLYDLELGRKLAANGHEKLQERFGWKYVTAQVANLLGAVAAPVG